MHAAFAARIYASVRKSNVPKKKPEIEDESTIAELPTPPEIPPLRVEAPGYYDMHMLQYLLDPCPYPSISKGTAFDVFYRTLKRAAYRHPRIGAAESLSGSAANFGTAVHNEITGGRVVRYLPDEFKDWRKDAARALRDNCHANWEVPMLAHERQRVIDAAGVLRHLVQSEIGDHVASFEKTVIYEDNGVWQRGRCDWLTDTHDIELKTCTNCNPVDWVKFACIRGGYDIQAAIRDEAHRQLGHPRKFVWAIVEDEAPHDAVWLEASESMIDAGRQKLNAVAPKWREALMRREFPSYKKTVALAPTRAVYDLEERL